MDPMVKEASGWSPLFFNEKDTLSSMVMQKWTMACQCEGQF
jgi:hypothetical protein